MNAMTCTEVQEQLDLLAADACDPATQDALEAHLRACPACADQFAVSRRLVGLLDVHLNQGGLERLRQRLDEQARPARKPRLFAPVVRRVLAAAALILIVVGLTIWIPNWRPDPIRDEPQFALLVEARKPVKMRAPDKEKAEPPTPLPAHVRAAKDAREELVKAQREGKLPLPPIVALELTLRNESKRAIEIHLGDASALLTLDLPKEGVIRISVPQAPEPDFLQPRTLTLAPGEQHIIHIERLIAGERGKLEYIYVNEPGEYDVTVSLRITADEKAVTVTGAPTRIKVVE